jgi:hypothetical protein
MAGHFEKQKHPHETPTPFDVLKRLTLEWVSFFQMPHFFLLYFSHDIHQVLWGI